MSNKELNIISKLMFIAKKSKLNRKHASAICCGKKVLYTSVNTSRTKYNKYYTVCGHSEVNCIHHFVKKCWDKKQNKCKMRKYTLYVIRRYNNSSYGLWAESAPCLHCLNVIRQYGFKKIVYIDKNLQVKSIKTKNYNTSFISSCNKLIN